MAAPLTRWKGNRHPSIEDTVTVDGDAFPLTGFTVKLKSRLEGSSTLKIDGAAVVTDPAAGEVRYDFSAADVDTAGEYVAWWELTETATGKTQDTPEFELLILEHAPVPLSALALTTIPRVERFLDRTGGAQAAEEQREDWFLALLINTYSAAIVRYCQRQFTPERNGTLQSDALLLDQTKTFTYDGSGYVTLAPFEIRTVTAVTIDTDMPTASQRVLRAQTSTLEAEYRFEPRHRSPLGTYLYAMVEPTSARLIGRRLRGQLSVRGDWGAAAGIVQDTDVELAALIAVSHAFRNPEAFSGRDLGAVSYQEPTEAFSRDLGVPSLPQASRALLTPFKRIP